MANPFADLMDTATPEDLRQLTKELLPYIGAQKVAEYDSNVYCHSGKEEHLEYLSPESVGKELGVSLPMVLRLARNADLPTMMLYGKRCVNRIDFEEWKDSHSDLLARIADSAKPK